MNRELQNNNIYAACSGLGLGLSDFTLLQETNDERFGFISFIRSKSTSKVMIVKERFERNPSQKLEVLLRQAHQLNSSFLTVFDIIEDIKLRTLKVYVEYFPLDLSQQIQKNIQKRVRFSQEEIFAMLYSSLNGLACLEKMHKPHGSMTPKSLFRIKKQVYKMHDNFLIAEPKSLYYQALAGKYRKYLAPELIRDIVDKKQTPNAYDPFKADIFSLGMCVLDAGLLGVYDDYIDMVTKQFDEQRLQDSLKLFGEMYPGPNSAILKLMLTMDLSKRPTASFLLKNIHNEAFNQSDSFYGVPSTATFKKQSTHYVDHYTTKLNQAIKTQIREINLKDTVPRFNSRDNDEHLNVTLGNTQNSKEYSTPQKTQKKRADSVFSTPNQETKTMACTPEKSEMKTKDSADDIVRMDQQYLMNKETALNRIIRESLQRSAKNLEFIRDVIQTPSMHLTKDYSKDLLNDFVKPELIEAQEFFEGLPLVMSTQVSLTPRHQSSSKM